MLPWCVAELLPEQPAPDLERKKKDGLELEAARNEVSVAEHAMSRSVSRATRQNLAPRRPGCLELPAG